MKKLIFKYEQAWHLNGDMSPSLKEDRFQKVEGVGVDQSGVVYVTGYAAIIRFVGKPPVGL